MTHNSLYGTAWLELSTDEDLDREDEDRNQVGPDAETESDDEQLVMESKRPEDWGGQKSGWRNWRRSDDNFEKKLKSNQ